MHSYQPKHILVTGAAGFIGSCFVKMMLNCYPNLVIVSLDKLTYAGNLKNLESLENTGNHYFHEADILDEDTIATLVRRYDIDTIVHFAAESHVDNSVQSPSEFIQTNVIGTFALLEQARKFWLMEKKWGKQDCRFHHISTDEVYGSLSPEDPPFSETSQYAPSSPYSASKAGSDHLVRSYFRTYDLPATISHCSNNFGPNQHSEKLIPVVIRSCFNSKKIPIYGDGKNIRDWLYVEDHCDAVNIVLQNGIIGETYNIGGNNEIDNLTLVKNICQVMDGFVPKNAPHENLISFVADRPGHDRKYAINNNKIHSQLKWKPKSMFQEALKKTTRHFLDQCNNTS